MAAESSQGSMDSQLNKTTEEVLEALNNRSLLVLMVEKELHQAVKQQIGQGFTELSRMLEEEHTNHLRILRERLAATNEQHMRNMEQLHLQIEERNQELLHRRMDCKKS